jgi:spermidine synthase
MIPQVPVVSTLLRNSKVEIIIDDGRRWLVRNPEKRFDLVVYNSSFHWRAHSSNLLSLEFLRLVRSHLNPGGMHFYNTTFGEEALLTGATEFPYALRVGSFLAVSDSPINVDKRRWAAALDGYAIDGKPIFDHAVPAQRAAIDKVLSLADTIQDSNGGTERRLEPRESLLRRLAGNRLITDDNMGSEWK